MPLPEDAPDFLKKCPCFQTSDLGKAGNSYTISKDGQFLMTDCLLSGILLDAFGIKDPPPPMPIVWKRKKIHLYASNLRGGSPRDGKYVYFTENGEDYISINYVVQIRSGKVSSIKEQSRDVKPAKPMSEF